MPLPRPISKLRSRPTVRTTAGRRRDLSVCGASIGLLALVVMGACYSPGGLDAYLEGGSAGFEGAEGSGSAVGTSMMASSDTSAETSGATESLQSTDSGADWDASTTGDSSSVTSSGSEDGVSSATTQDQHEDSESSASTEVSTSSEDSAETDTADHGEDSVDTETGTDGTGDSGSTGSSSSTGSTDSSELGDDSDASDDSEDCSDHLVACDGECIDPILDRRYCGASSDCLGPNAGQSCEDSDLCVGGSCVPDCASGELLCAGSCVDPDRDPVHCGAGPGCLGGQRCLATETCTNGECFPAFGYDLDWSLGSGLDGSDYGNDVVISDSGTIHVLGSAETLGRAASAPNTDLVVFEYGTDGRGGLEHRIAAEDGSVTGLALLVADDEIVVGGSFTGDLPGLAHVGGYDAFMAWIAHDGTIGQLKGWRNSGDEYVQGLAVAPDGSIWAAGTFPENDVSARRAAPSFALTQWSADGSNSPVGRWWHSQVISHALVVDNTGAIWVTGGVEGEIGTRVARGGRDIFLARLEPEGQLDWARQWGSDGDDFGQGLVLNAQGKAIVVGRAGGEIVPGRHAGRKDLFAAQVNEEGEVQWVRQWGTSEDDLAQDVVLSHDGQVIVLGETEGALGPEGHFGGFDLYLAQLDMRNGDVESEHQWGSTGDEWSCCLAVAADGALSAVGHGRPLRPRGEADSIEARASLDLLVTRWLAH